jgi:hypothetical protein
MYLELWPTQRETHFIGGMRLSDGLSLFILKRKS